MGKLNYIEPNELDHIFGSIEPSEKIETLVDLAKDFVKKREELSLHMGNKDLDNFRLISHSLKSNCRYIGAKKLSQCSFLLEKVPSFESSDFEQNWQTFLATHKSTMSEIKSTLKELSEV